MAKRIIKTTLEENQIKCIDCINCTGTDKEHLDSNKNPILGSCKHHINQILINHIDKNCQLSKPKL